MAEFHTTAAEQSVILALRDMIAGGGSLSASNPLDSALDLGGAPEEAPKKGRGKAKDAPPAQTELDLGGGGIDDMLSQLGTPAHTVPTLDDVRAELKLLVVKATGKDVCAKLFGIWKIKTIDSIPDESRAKFIEQVKAINAKVK